MSARADDPDWVRSIIFPDARRHPYYIFAPRFVETSAGIRVLHTLVRLLNAAGEQAFVVPENGVDAGYANAALAPVLNESTAQRHRDAGRNPIVIYPETTVGAPLGGGVVVRYVLNHPGHLNGPKEFDPADLVFAYSQDIARALERADGVFYLPVSDPIFFCPPLREARSGACAYLGKIVDVHGYHPTLSADIKLITRDRPDSPSREEIRRLFQTCSYLNVYENTALATEALLCGCAVVYRPNPHLGPLIATTELGEDGFAFTDDPAAIERAIKSAPLFRARYEAALATVGSRLADFVAITQAAAGEVQARPVTLPDFFQPMFMDRLAAKTQNWALSVREIGWGATAYRGLRKVGRLPMSIVRKRTGPAAPRS